MKSKDMAAYMRNRRAKRRQQLIDLFGGVCRECGSDENLEFNHINRDEKSFTLSGKGLDGKWVSILEEASKCELLCVTHHRERTQEQYSTGQIKQWNDKKHLPYVHGTMRAYQEIACRCEYCRRAKRVYRLGITKYSEVLN